MASVSRINGFRPVKTISGAPYSGKANLYFMASGDSTVVMVGDAVKIAGDARAASGAPTVTRCGATDIPVGVVVGILFSGVGNGSGLSGDCLTEHGHQWIGCDISQDMLMVAKEQEVEGDILLNDMGQVLAYSLIPSRASWSISAIFYTTPLVYARLCHHHQWLYGNG